MHITYMISSLLNGPASPAGLTNNRGVGGLRNRPSLNVSINKNKNNACGMVTRATRAAAFQLDLAWTICRTTSKMHALFS
jgi:hypothetical protein